MAISKPIGGNNALEAVAFVVGLSRALNERESESLVSLQTRFNEELPGFLTLKGVQFHLAEGSPGGPVAAQRQRMSGVLLQRFMPDGKVAWALRPENDRVIVQCHQYTSWDAVWPQARKYLLATLRAIAATDNSVAGVAVQFIDKFEYLDVPADYTISEVFREDSPYLTAQAKKAGVAWHIHQGWFETYPIRPEGPVRVLNMLNLQSAEVNAKLVATIDHVQQLTLGEANLTIDSLFGAADSAEAGSDAFNTMFETLHVRNSDLVRRTLCDNKLAAIGLAK
jgi:uncharacterized protein (TIGR04255 family)